MTRQASTRALDAVHLRHPDVHEHHIGPGGAGLLEAALDKLRSRLQHDGSWTLQSRRVGEDVVIGTNADYLEHLAQGGHGLGDTDRFHAVVPGAKDATSVFFMDFDAGDWLAKLAESDGDRQDAEPLDSLGMTVTKNGDQQRILLRVSFDD